MEITAATSEIPASGNCGLGAEEKLSLRSCRAQMAAPMNDCLANTGAVDGRGLETAIQAMIEVLKNSFDGFMTLLNNLLLKNEPPKPATTPTTPTVTSPPAATELPKGVPLKKTGQFLWKPESAIDGNLVIYLPKGTGKAKSVKILSPDRKTVLEEGKSSVKDTSRREQYRFSKKGESFPDGAIVQITKRNGKIKEVIIGDTAKRQRR